MFDQQNRSSWLAHSLHLLEHLDRVLVVAETEHVHDGVEAVVGERRQLFGLVADDLVRRVRCAREARAQDVKLLGVRVHENDVGDGVRVDADVDALAGGELEHAAVRVGEDVAADRGDFVGLVNPDAREGDGAGQAEEKEEAGAKGHDLVADVLGLAAVLEVLARLPDLRVAEHGLDVLGDVVGVLVDVLLTPSEDGVVARLLVPDLRFDDF